MAILVALAMVFDVAYLLHIAHRLNVLFVPITFGGVSLGDILVVGVVAAIGKELLARTDRDRVINMVLSGVLTILLAASVLWIAYFGTGYFL